MAERARPKIAVFMEFPTALGGERSLLAVAERLQTAFEFCLIAPEHGTLSQEIERVGLAHVPLSLRNRQGVRREDAEILHDLQQVLAAEQVDLLHANSLTLARFLGRHRSAWSLPVTAHLRDMMQLSQKALDDLGTLDRLVAVSAATADYYRQQGLGQIPLEVIHNGIQADQFAQPAARPLHRELQLPPDSHFACVIGQIGLRKGHDVLFEALTLVAPQHPDWHFLILGERFSVKQESRDFVAQLEAIASRGKIEDQIHWLGYLNEIPSILPQCELLLHPARQEPFGRVLLEAAAAQVAIVASNVGGTPEMLRHGEHAWLIPPDDPQPLASACEQLMQQPALRQQLAQQAHAHIADQFSLDRACTAHRQFWQTALNGRS